MPSLRGKPTPSRMHTRSANETIDRVYTWNHECCALCVHKGIRQGRPRSRAGACGSQVVYSVSWSCREGLVRKASRRVPHWRRAAQRYAEWRAWYDSARTRAGPTAG